MKEITKLQLFNYIFDNIDNSIEAVNSFKIEDVNVAVKYSTNILGEKEKKVSIPINKLD